MCDPVSAMMVVGTAVSAIGAKQQSDAAAASANYQAGINRQNAILSERRAKDAVERGQMEENRKLREGTMLKKQQEASYSAANIDMGYGSPLDVITSTDMAAKLDADIIRANAEREAEDYDQQAWNYRNQAGLNKFEAKNAKAAGKIAMASTVLSGGSGVMKYRASL